MQSQKTSSDGGGWTKQSESKDWMDEDEGKNG